MLSRLLARNTCRILSFCTLWAVAVAWPASAFAQIPTQAPAGHADVIPAVIVFFGVVLGMILVCRSAGRSADMKLEALDEE
jgi:hypothetical protein